MIHSKNIFITGSRGMLGKELVKQFALNGHKVYGIDRQMNPDPNLTSHVAGNILEDQILEMLDLVKMDCVIHCAGIVDVDLCETNPELAYLLHETTTKKLVNLTSPHTQFIYLSTDSVFDGNIIDGYQETDLTSPLNTYAFSKVKGEFEALQHPNGLVIRTNIYGFHQPLSHSLVEWALFSMQQEKKVIGFDDIIFNPLYTKQLALILSKLIDSQIKGVWHFGSNKPISKFHFLQQLGKKFGFSHTLIQRGNSTDTHMKAKRPLCTYLNTSKANTLLGNIPTLEEGLEMLKNDYLSYEGVDHA